MSCYLLFAVLVFVGGCGTAVKYEMPEITPLSFSGQVFDVREYGGVGDGVSSNTKAFADAITACCEAGGGRVLVPEGVWLTGAIVLKSNVDLHISEAAEVRFSTEPNDYLPVVFTRWEGIECYNYSALVYATDCNNIAITGKGKLNGQGQAWWGWKRHQGAAVQRLRKAGYGGTKVEERIFGTKEDGLRPCLIELINCEGVLIEGVTIEDSPFWTVHPVYCEEIIVRDVKIIASGPNTDGVNPDSCRNVIIEDCFFDTGDDCITLKSGRNEDGWRVGRACENILIRRCRTKRGHGGVVIGSEMSGGVRNVLIRDCHFDGTNRGIRIKSLRGRGGVVENIWVENVTMGKIKNEAIRLNMHYSSRVSPYTQRPPVFRNMSFKNITCKSAKVAVQVKGLPESMAENITFENVTVSAEEGMNISYAKSLNIRKCKIDVKNGAVVSLKDCKNALIEETGGAGEVFLRLEGEGTDGIILSNNDLSGVKKEVVPGKDVPAEAVVHK
ncbi:MAG: glycoside hydrolase family 28 protein [Planctomycetes bacterium]|nr:glycoside hydrolase family 28 protein [Planctomycetota bacterium]